MRPIVLCLALLLASCGDYDMRNALTTQFDTPDLRCGSVENVEIGRHNGTPIYELRCRAYFPREGYPIEEGDKQDG